LFVTNQIYKPFLLNSRAQAVPGKNEQSIPKNHGAGPQHARGPMQLQRLKAGPASCHTHFTSQMTLIFCINSNMTKIHDIREQCTNL